MADNTTDRDPQQIQSDVLTIIRKLLEELGNEAALRQLNLNARIAQNLGLDSLGKVELFTRLEAHFGIRFSDQAMIEIETPQDIIRFLLQGKGDKVESYTVVAPTVVEANVPPTEAETLVEVLLYQARQKPEQTHIILRNEDHSETKISFKQLLQKSLQVANGLRQRGLQPKETVAIMLPTSEEFFYSFFGVLLAGGVTVPLYPPFRADLLEEYAKRQVGILKNASSRFLLTFSQAKSVALLLRPQVPSMVEVLEIPTLIEGQSSKEEIPQMTKDFPALIQYTSGSTGNPKGVLLLHENLLANMRSITQSIQVGPEDVCISWLPLYHDMGLIGAWLCSLYCGNPIYIMSPLAFLNRPERWLWAIHQYRGTISTAPNFAYELCLRKIKDADIEGLDLSSWRVAMNGAEPISRSTLDHFVQRFQKYQFSEKALMPVYGLAESCVAVCFPPTGRGPVYDRIKRELFEQKGIAEVAQEQEDWVEFVGNGGPFPGHEVRIVDEQGNELADRVQGVLQFRGPSRMNGYYQNKEATDETILEEGWCDSGDLAYRVEQDYFITGRKKDLIIKGGRNLYPQEIEELVADVEGIRRGCVVAFGLRDLQAGTELICVAAETKSGVSQEELSARVQQQLTQHLGLPADKLIFLEPGSIPKTSSGKVRRAACKTMYQDQSLMTRKKSTWRQIAQIALKSIPSFFLKIFPKMAHFLWILWYSAILLFTFLPLWALLHLIRIQSVAAFLTKTWCRLFLFLMRIRLEIKGIEHLQKNQPVLLVSNHTSYLDVLIYTAILSVPFRFLGKEEAKKSPLIGPFMRSNQHIGIDRFDAQQSLKDKEKVKAYLARQISVVIFPEATFSRAVGLRPFRLGAFHLSCETNIPIVPLALNGARKILPPGNFLPKRGKIVIQFGAPLKPQENSWQEVLRLRNETLSFIMEHCGEPRLNLSYSDIPE